jgi:beta-phosphoglucomutase
MCTYELWVFDMDGVLVDTTRCHRLAYERLWMRCGIAGPAYEEIAGRSTADVVREWTAALRPSPQQIDDWVAFKQREARALLAGADVLFDDTLPALRALRDRGIAMAVATGAARTTATLLLQRTGLMDFFRAVVTAEDVTAGKPDPQIFRRAIERAGGTPQTSVVVEDSLAGIDAGIACGAGVVCVRSGVQREHPAFLGSFPDLLAAVERVTSM